MTTQQLFAAIQAVSTEQFFVGISAFSALAVAFLTFILFRLQRRQFQHDQEVADATYNFSMFEKRLEVYLAARDFCSDCMRNGRPNVEEAGELMRIAVASDFLFGKEVETFLTNVWRKTIDYDLCHDQWEPLRERAFEHNDLSEEERAEKEKYLNEKHEIEAWFRDHASLEKLKDMFGKYLKFNEKISS